MWPEVTPGGHAGWQIGAQVPHLSKAITFFSTRDALRFYNEVRGWREVGSAEIAAETPVIFVTNRRGDDTCENGSPGRQQLLCLCR